MDAVGIHSSGLPARTRHGWNYGWLNPFYRFEYSQPPRANTCDDAERGAVGDDKPKGDFTIRNQIQRTILSSPINILLLAAPAGIALWALKTPGPAVFIVNFIAIIPLATLLSDSTEQVALRTGDVLGGLINATFGNSAAI
ncbi:hypothetical protein F5B17DRAFT_436407 [Nemania serpens]|nr:hypothetical protein F5B17DRAFT_436407 [Nemania serpens]